MRFGFSRRLADRREPWSPLGRTLAWTHYQCLVIEHLRDLASIPWLVGGMVYLTAVAGVESVLVLAVGWGVVALSCVAALPYLWLARRCLIGTKENACGPLAMIYGGHAEWRDDWAEKVESGNERLSSEASSIRSQLKAIALEAKEERARGEDREVAVDEQRRVLASLFDAIPSDWDRGSLLFGAMREETSQAWSSDEPEKTARLSMANMVLQLFATYGDAVAYRTNGRRLVVLLDRRGGDTEVKVRIEATLCDLGGKQQWRYASTTCYFFFPGFAEHPGYGMIPNSGDVHDALSRMLGNPLTETFRYGALSLVNPLNAFRCVNLLQGFGYSAESLFGASSTTYRMNNFLGHGDLTDLALISRYRNEAMAKRTTPEAFEFTHPTELFKKEGEQFAASAVGTMQRAEREITSGLEDEALLLCA